MYFPRTRTFIVENPNRQPGEKKNVYMDVTGLGLPAIERTSTGMPSADAKALKLLAGEPEEGHYGLAYEHLK